MNLNTEIGSWQLQDQLTWLLRVMSSMIADRTLCQNALVRASHIPTNLDHDQTAMDNFHPVNLIGHSTAAADPQLVAVKS